MTIFSQISRCISERVIVRWAHTARQFVSIAFTFHPYNIYRDCPRVVPRGNKNVVKIAIFGVMHWIKHRITRKLFKIDRNMLRGVWQALNCLSIRGTYCVIIAGASPGETTRGQSNLTKSASRGAHSPVRGHPRGLKVVPLNFWGRVSY